MAVWVSCVTGCQSDEEPNADADVAELAELDAATVTVTHQHWPTVIRSMGSFQADEESTVGAKISGMVQEVHVQIGDPVRAGDPLVTLDQQQAKLLILQAEAQLQQARSAIGMDAKAGIDDVDPDNSAPVREAKAMWSEGQASLTRAARLLRQNAMSQSEYDQVAAAEQVAAARHQAAENGVREKIALVRVRQAELEVAKQRLADTFVLSPFDGFVQRRSVAPGAFLNVGQPLAVIVRTDPLRFRGSVPERYAMSIQRGQEVRLNLAALDKPIVATITRTTPSLDQRSRALVFEADVANAASRLQTGLFAEAEIVISPDAIALAIPSSAIVEFAGTQKVWKVTDGVAGEQPVLVGPERNGLRKVIEGVDEGDVVLAEGRLGRVAKITTGRQDEPVELAIRDRPSLNGDEGVRPNAVPVEPGGEPDVDSSVGELEKPGSS